MPAAATAADRTGWRRQLRRLRKRTLPILLVVEALGVFAVTPLIELKLLPRESLGVTLILILALGMLSLQQRAWIGRLLVVLGAILLPIQVWRYVAPGALILVLHPLGTILFLVLISWALTDTLFRSQRISLHQVMGGVVLYLNVGLTFALAYTLVEHVMPGALSLPPPGPDKPVHPTYFAYFSFATLTTVGYGDTIPVSPVARSLAMLEATLGQLFPAIILARLVSIELADREQRLRAKEQRAERKAHQHAPERHGPGRS
ncbi:MAG: potassium channel family protein [Geminicoccaceae bacterium]